MRLRTWRLALIWSPPAYGRYGGACERAADVRLWAPCQHRMDRWHRRRSRRVLDLSDGARPGGGEAPTAQPVIPPPVYHLPLLPDGWPPRRPWADPFLLSARVATEECKVTDNDIIDALASGASVRQLALQLGRGKHSIYEMLYRRGLGVQRLRRGTVAVRTLNQVASLFGVHTGRVERWIRRGWLKHGPQDNATRRIRRRYTLIADTAIMEFMTKRNAWPSWEAERIADPDWQDYARHVRSAGTWVRVTDMLRTQGYDPGGACTLIRRGRIPNAVLIDRVWYVWQEGNHARD